MAKQKEPLINSIYIQKANNTQFETIKHFIKEFELDNRELLQEQFLAAVLNSELVGFGRIRNRGNCYELCSLGVIEPERLKGIGKKLVDALVAQKPDNLYLVCIIPAFFEPLGFKTVTEYPDTMQEKLAYCTNELVVPEPYVVMKYSANNG